MKGKNIMDNRKLLNQVGETCSEQIKCYECNMQIPCRKDIYEDHPELKNRNLEVCSKQRVN